MMSSRLDEEDVSTLTEGAAYRAPVTDIMLALQVVGLGELLALDDFASMDQEFVKTALEEFGRIASDVIAPTDRLGDLVGARHDRDTSEVRMPRGFHLAYQHYVDGGWGTLPFPSKFGGGELPPLVALALQEIFSSANMALALNPILTQGAIEAILNWGEPDQQLTYLPKLMTGEWTGTMNLTEPDAGSDLGEIHAMATPRGDGFWSVSGTKIFITWGEHDLVSNIIHLVLARTPDAPAGTRGLSLFIVPKFGVLSDGTLGERNSLKCLRIEEKLGIHASPTCVMEFDGAVGELVGPLHGGMRAMFTMMNAARLSIGAQGPAIGEKAFQNALAYATNRLQGRASGVKPPERSAIIAHPDVRRMLLTMTTCTQAARLLIYQARSFADQGLHDRNTDRSDRAKELADLLTPIAKAWSTDVGCAVASLGIQVLGGAGYVEEFGMAQRMRDIRIAPIYEGTNGIQALDLVTRKLPRDGGHWMRHLIGSMEETIASQVEGVDRLAVSYAVLEDAVHVLSTTTDWLLAHLANPKLNDDVIAGATSYLELCGLTISGWLMLRRALFARSTGHEEIARTEAESNFFASEVVARATGLARPITSGAGRLSEGIGFQK